MPTQPTTPASFIDMRSDTVTRPCEAMRQAMFDAEVGDDVFGDDPTINELESYTAQLLGKENGIYLTSGTMSNLSAMLSHCQRGEEVITGEKYHTFIDEAQGAAVLGSVALHPIMTDTTGYMKLDDMLGAIKEDDFHYPISRMLSLENTVSGCVQPQDHINTLTDAAHERGLKVHMDGARLMNAAVKQQLPPAALVEKVDSVSLCLSKGLGAPVGSVLVGDAAFIQRARRLRKMLGGGMRQAGGLAAAGLYALKNNINSLAEDHVKAETLANGLKEISQLSIDMDRVQTNMVFIQVRPEDAQSLQTFMLENGVIILGARYVLHRDISDDDVGRVIELFQQFYQQR
uniref:Low-specificity L-threonine aldolase (EC) n=1 Tax=uncultured Thiotrichaceae bacterium TaxID=298394 RepID=A0A6S6U8H1_9GAMM|nr:MAG: Low-specificity L-threonine aldolase (EC [uncultured Thiotrichaceae bacterium]